MRDHRYRDLAFFPHMVVSVRLSVSKERVQWSEDNLTILESLLIPRRKRTVPGFRTWDPEKKGEGREVPPLINSIRHGLLRVRAPILCYAFWRALSMGAHPLRAGPVCDTGPSRSELIQATRSFGALPLILGSLSRRGPNPRKPSEHNSIHECLASSSTRARVLCRAMLILDTG